MECVAARAFRLLLADHADAAARVRSGMRIVTAWEFDLYGGTVLLAAVHGRRPNPTNRCSASSRPEDALGITDPAVVGRLQHGADGHVESLRSWLGGERAAGRTVLAYGAASRAVALFSRARIDSRLLAAVADASPAKQGRRMPGTDIPIVSPDELLAANPDRVLLTLPDLLPEVSARFPELDGRWRSTVSDRLHCSPEGTPMTTILFNPDITDDERRTRLYSGQVLMFGASPESLALVEHARKT